MGKKVAVPGGGFCYTENCARHDRGNADDNFVQGKGAKQINSPQDLDNAISQAEETLSAMPPGGYDAGIKISKQQKRQQQKAYLGAIVGLGQAKQKKLDVQRERQITAENINNSRFSTQKPEARGSKTNKLPIRQLESTLIGSKSPEARTAMKKLSDSNGGSLTLNPKLTLKGLPSGWQNSQIYSVKDTRPEIAVVSPQGNTFIFWKDEGSTLVAMVEKGYRPSLKNGNWAEYVSDTEERSQWDSYEGNMKFESEESAHAFANNINAEELSQAHKMMEYIARRK
jgi:hypothetical protein